MQGSWKLRGWQFFVVAGRAAAARPVSHHKKLLSAQSN
jgi:hypothetical protein